MTVPADLTRETQTVAWTRQGTTIDYLLLSRQVAEEAAAAAAASAVEAQNAANSGSSPDNLGATALGFVMCPGGVTPDRPTARTDLAYVWFSPSPPSTAPGKLIPGLDFWCVLGI